jgi:serine/threonine protein kinase
MRTPRRASEVAASGEAIIRMNVQPALDTLPHARTEVLCAACGEPTPPGICGHDSCGKPTALRERWNLLAVAGRGGYSVTYKASDSRDGTIVAIKESSLVRVASKTARTLLFREVEVLRQLRHPRIPAFLDAFEQGHGKSNALYLVQEYVDGGPLDACRLSVDETLDVLDQLLEVLGWLHERSPSIIHRDVKPGNILRRADGHIMLIDFGMVKDASRRTGATLEVGTPGFQAPEQIVGDAVPASDVYAAAATTLAILTGRNPLQLSEYEDGGPRFVVSSDLGLTREMRALLERMLAAEVAPRPANAAVARDALRAARRLPPQEGADRDAPTVAATIPVSPSFLGVEEGPEGRRGRRARITGADPHEPARRDGPAHAATRSSATHTPPITRPAGMSSPTHPFDVIIWAVLLLCAALITASFVPSADIRMGLAVSSGVLAGWGVTRFHPRSNERLTPRAKTLAVAAGIVVAALVPTARWGIMRWRTESLIAAFHDEPVTPSNTVDDLIHAPQRRLNRLQSLHPDLDADVLTRLQQAQRGHV